VQGFPIGGNPGPYELRTDLSLTSFGESPETCDYHRFYTVKTVFLPKESGFSTQVRILPLWLVWDRMLLATQL
jgi:hypothetical protein